MPQLAFLPDSQRLSGHHPLLRLLLPVWVPFSRIFIRSQNIHNTLVTTFKHKWAACWCMSIPEIFPAPFYQLIVMSPLHCPMTLSLYSFFTHHIVPWEEARGSNSAAAIPHFQFVHCKVFFVIESESATLSPVMVHLCFNHFLIWSVYACQICGSQEAPPRSHG